MTGHPKAEPVETSLPEAAGKRPPGLRLFRRFRRSQNGATAIEFAALATPFFMLLAAIVEVTMMLWTSQVLEESVSVTSRCLLTGRTQPSSPDCAAATTAAFKQKVCDNASTLIDCAKLKIDVRSYGSFASATTGTTSPVQGGALNTNGYGYTQPAAEQIVVVRAVLEYSLFFTQWSSALADIGDGKHAIVASTTFRTEPYAGT